jgi:hypothetical protein
MLLNFAEKLLSLLFVIVGSSVAGFFVFLFTLLVLGATETGSLITAAFTFWLFGYLGIQKLFSPRSSKP